MLWCAYQRAAASGTQLRLVVAAAIVRRVLTVNGLDRLIPVYPSLEAATAAAAPAAAVSPAPDLAPDGQDGPGQRAQAGGQRRGMGHRASRVLRASRGRCCAG
jgi:hypothetical protein